jgi:hypothetical protein
MMAPMSAVAFKVNEQDRAWVDALCVPQPLATFTEKIVLSGARERISRKIYIRAKGHDSPGFDAAMTRVRAIPSWQVYEMACGHDVMIDMPNGLTKILLEAA